MVQIGSNGCNIGLTFLLIPFLSGTATPLSPKLNLRSGRRQENAMIALFDIFRTDRDRNLVWCEAATTLDEARAKVQSLAELEKTDYVIFSQITGNRIVIQPEHADQPADRDWPCSYQ
jgi:hypothetical protein